MLRRRDTDTTSWRQYRGQHLCTLHLQLHLLVCFHLLLLLLLLLIDIFLIVDTKRLQPGGLGQDTSLYELQLNALIVVILYEGGHVQAYIQMLDPMGICYNVGSPTDKLIQVLSEVDPHALEHTQTHGYRGHLEGCLPELHRDSHIGQDL